jgi:hypothetical protein
MTRASVAGVFVLSLGLVVGCGGGDKEANRDRASGAADEQSASAGRPAPITQTGCLSSRDGQYVLTDLEPAAESSSGQPATEAYQLVGNDEELRQHVGKQVRVAGEAEPSQVAEVRESTPPSQPGQQATGTAGERPPAAPQPGQPQVSTSTETRLEVARLRVQSVTPTGQSCAAEATGGASSTPGRQRPPQ